MTSAGGNLDHGEEAGWLGVWGSFIGAISWG
jgi:hypothetical protein